MNPILALIGWILLAISGIGALLSCILEIRAHKELYFVLMKIFAFTMALSGVLIGLSS